MIKVQNGIASRTELPAFLRGLAPESLLDLTWTDPALGVQDLAWWPEENQTQPLGKNEKYGDEVLTVDAERKVVMSYRTVIQMTQEEIDVRVAAQEAEKQQHVNEITERIALLQTQLTQLTQE